MISINGTDNGPAGRGFADPAPDATIMGRCVLYLVRHGAALSAASDPLRPLSPDGQDEIERLAQFLAQAHIPLGRILHSGVERAAQTAAILGQTLLPAGPLEQHDGLLPGDPVAPMVRRLAQLREATMVVGHQPFMGALTTALLCPERGHDIMGFPTGGTVCLASSEWDRSWRLVWALAPTLLPPARARGREPGDGEVRQ